MHLADFIEHDMDAILAEWEAFASTLLPAASGMSSLALRDHAQAILEAVAKDLRTAQTRREQSEKSKGRAPRLEGVAQTAAQTHAVLRARSGFDINQLVAEYRALRASVLRLWMDDASLDRSGVQDLIRFNEAIDQAVAESVGHFHTEVEQARNLLLGMLGHDMRSPLNTILLTSKYLARLHAGDDVSVAAERLIHSGASMQALLDDLVDFNRAHLGLGIKMQNSPVDLAAVVADEVEQLRGAHPDRRIELATSGDLHCRCDGVRVQQVLRNLVSNAIRYGFAETPVRVSMHGEPDSVRLEVANSGRPIDPAALGEIFDPLKRAVAQGCDDDAHTGLGLGLFIVREIAKAHGGEVAVRSTSAETAFTVRLPRENAMAQDAARGRS